jgi:hypothetical protein
MNETPPGRAPLLVSDGVGKPVEVTANVPGVPAVNTVLFALAIAGACGAGFTVRIKFCVASGDPVLCAVNTIL